MNWTTLFDGSIESFRSWRMSTIKAGSQPEQSDPGHFTIDRGGELVAHPGTDLGLLWHTKPTPPDFVLDLEWKLSRIDDNSGVFVRFPNLDSRPDYNNTAWVAINFGYEVQINEPGVPDGAPHHLTGAIYGETSQSFTRVVAKPLGEWNHYSIIVDGQTYVVMMNGVQVTRFVAPASSERGVPGGFIGIQTHTGNVAFRNLRIRPL